MTSSPRSPCFPSQASRTRSSVSTRSKRVEKALKAALAARSVPFSYTHDLDGLLELCKSSGLQIPDELDGVDRLAPYGVHMRYGMSHAQGLDREQALQWAAAAIEWARSAIESRSA
jgi:HEPN domain-containing protein